MCQQHSEVQEEVFRVIGFLSGTHQLMAKLLYSSGLRLMECVRLRVQDVDFAQRQIIVRILDTDFHGFKNGKICGNQ